MNQRPLVLAAAVALTVAGIWAALRLPLDAVPDITPPQVQINTGVNTLAPEEIEKQVTFPIESEMSGIPGMVELRSLSKSGLSQVTMLFEEGTDLHRARQIVSERLQQLSGELPEGITPQLAPLATGLGEIFYYSVDYKKGATNRPSSRREQLMQLKLIQDYQIKPLLRQTHGIAEVNTSGGYEKTWVVQPDPQRLLNAGLTVPDLASAILENTRNAGGGWVELGGEQVTIRANSRITRPAQIGEILLKHPGSGQPLRVKDVARIEVGSAFRTGASTENGEEAVVGSAIMMAGGNSRITAAAVREKLAAIQHKLSQEVEIRTLYDRSELVDRTIETVEKNLTEGALLVVVILFLFLGDFRAACIVALAIPLSMMFALLGMVELRVPGNLMSLGAVDFGLIIDGAVVMAENILRHISARQHALGRLLTPSERRSEVLASAREVVRPMFFGVLIITAVYVPVLALQGIEGRMFRPMAVVVMLALGGSLALSLTLIPVLCSLFLRGLIQEKESWLVRITKRIYSPLLALGLRHKLVVLLPVIGLLTGSVVVFNRLGAEFIPELDEGDGILQLVKAQSCGLQAAIGIQVRSETILMSAFPEIRHVFSRMGSAEIATDPMDPGDSDTYIMLKPSEEWRRKDGRRITKQELMELMQLELARNAPGQAILINQPIQMRFDEIMAGARAELSLKIFGDEHSELDRLAEAAREILRGIPGAADVEFDKIGGTPQMQITPDPMAMARHGLHPEEVNRAVEAALAGAHAGYLPEGNRQYPITVRLAEESRSNPDVIRRLPVSTDSGGVLTLGQVVTISNLTQIGTIQRENAQRRAAILINVRGRDTAGFVEQAEAELRSKLKMPEGYWREFGGQYQNLVAARERLMFVVPLTLGMIFFLIWLSFGSASQAALIFLSVPLAATGGVLALWLRGMPFTISAAVGFIALSGIAVLNGIMLISFMNQLREQGASLRQAVIDGTLTRLRPKLMTALVASFGFVPMALSSSAGAEVQRPLATVVIGGIVTSTFLTLVVLPVLYEWSENRRRAASDDECSSSSTGVTPPVS